MKIQDFYRTDKRYRIFTGHRKNTGFYKKYRTAGRTAVISNSKMCVFCTTQPAIRSGETVLGSLAIHPFGVNKLLAINRQLSNRCQQLKKVIHAPTKWLAWNCTAAALCSNYSHLINSRISLATSALETSILTYVWHMHWRHHDSNSGGDFSSAV